MTDLIDGLVIVVLNSGIFFVIYKLCDASETDVADRGELLPPLRYWNCDAFQLLNIQSEFLLIVQL